MVNLGSVWDSLFNYRDEMQKTSSKIKKISNKGGQYLMLPAEVEKIEISSRQALSNVHSLLAGRKDLQSKYGDLETELTSLSQVQDRASKGQQILLNLDSISTKIENLFADLSAQPVPPSGPKKVDSKREAEKKQQKEVVLESEVDTALEGLRDIYYSKHSTYDIMSDFLVEKPPGTYALVDSTSSTSEKPKWTLCFVKEQDPTGKAADVGGLRITQIGFGKNRAFTFEGAPPNFRGESINACVQEIIKSHKLTNPYLPGG